MVSIQATRTANVRQIFSAFPKSLGFHLCKIAKDEYQFQSTHCVVRLRFEPYQTEVSSTVFFDPNEPNEEMAFWILSHVRQISIHVPDIERPYYFYGKAIIDNCMDLLTGDFSAREEYKKYKDRIVNHSLAVLSLNADHPIRIQYDNYDLRWLLAIEAKAN